MIKEDCRGENTLEDDNLLELRSLDSSYPFSYAIIVFGDNELKCSKCFDRKA